jgi:hypothetical protein
MVDINNYIRVCDVSISPWWFAELEQKWTGVGELRHTTRIGPKYSTAITNKLFLDIDCLTPDGEFKEESYDSMQKLWEWATEHNFKRDVSFTAGGYQMYIAANVKAQYYKNTVKDLVERLKLSIDDESVSLVDMRRVIGSYNYGSDNKSPRRRFCISLKDWEVGKPWAYHVETARKQRKQIYEYGHDVYKPPKTLVTIERKEFSRKVNVSFDAGVDEIFDEYGYAYSDLCEPIRALIEKDHVRHFERLRVVKYLRSIIGMDYGDVVILLPKLLNSPHGNNHTDGSHSIEEGQVDSVYANQSRFSPVGMREDGYCDPNCRKCDEYMELLNKL